MKQDNKSNDVRKPARKRFSDVHFRVGLTFSGIHRPYVASVAESVRSNLGVESVFYDDFYTPHLARPDLDLVLTEIYNTRSDLLVVFLSRGYSHSEWCGVEWRVVRDIIKRREADSVMYVRFDDSPVEGTLSIDGYIDASKYSPDQMARFIVERLG